MSSLCRRLYVRTYCASYAVPILGAPWRRGCDLASGASAIEMVLRDVPPRKRRVLRDLLKEGGVK